jgi:hypothetical protein
VNLPRPLVLAAATMTLLAGTTLPASAADTTTTFSLTGGTLTLSVSASAGLTGEATGIAANTITGTLGQVLVTDARGLITGWVTSAVSSTFTGSSLSVSNGVTYTTGDVTKTGLSTVTGVSAELITAVKPVAAATAAIGNNTASWNPTLDVSMPAGALAGAYTGTVTTSLV